MKSLRHRLPSLISLMTFEAAARTLNFTRAAQELHVSQAAVSKQIRYLEEFLELKLFIRQGRRVELSHQGKYLYNKINSSFNFMADAVEEVRSIETVRSITIAANNAIAHYWLGRVIECFREAHPAFDSGIRILSSDCTFDLFADEVDIAIAYDPPESGQWPRQLLFQEELYPVASQKYLQANPIRDASAEHLLEHALLDYERIEPNWINWRVWLDALGADTRKLKVASYANSYLSLVCAAEHSQGITLGTRYLLDEQLALGRLVRVSSLNYVSGKGYYIACNDHRQKTRDMTLMHDWILGFEQSRS